MDNFYKEDKSYLKLLKKLEGEDKQLFIEVVGSAILYGMERIQKVVKLHLEGK